MNLNSTTQLHFCANWIKSSERNLLPTLNRDVAVSRNFNNMWIGRKLRLKKGLVVAGLFAAGVLMYKGNDLLMAHIYEKEEMDGENDNDNYQDARRLAGRIRVHPYLLAAVNLGGMKLFRKGFEGLVYKITGV